MARGGVHEAGAGIVSDVIALKQRHLEVITAVVSLQGMGTNPNAQCRRLDIGATMIARPARLTEDFSGQRIGPEPRLAGLEPVFGRPQVGKASCGKRVGRSV